MSTFFNTALHFSYHNLSYSITLVKGLLIYSSVPLSPMTTMAHHKRDRGDSNDMSFVKVEPTNPPLVQRRPSTRVSPPFHELSSPIGGASWKETQALSDCTEEPTDNQMHAQLNEIYEALEKIKEGEAKLSELKDRASRDIERLKGRSNSLIDGATKRISIHEWNFLSWDEVSTTIKIPDKHHAIDIPRNEPTGVSLKVIVYNEDTETKQIKNTTPPPSKVTVPSAQDQRPVKRVDLPERIRINSERIQEVLDFDLWNGSLAYLDGETFTILRPFKLLNYLEPRIRQRLDEFVAARAILMPDTTEAQYDDLYSQEPAPDDPLVDQRQHLDSLSCSQLTGFIKDLRCLTKFIDEYIVPARQRLAKETGTVRFSDLWYVFPIGSLIYVKDKAIPQKVWRVVQRTGGRRYLSQPADMPVGDYTRKYTPFTLDCYHLDYDGNHYVPVYQRFQVNRFEGSQQLASLAVYPLHIAEREKTINRPHLLARAKTFIECTQISHRYYDGRSQFRSPKGDRLVDMVEGAMLNYANVSWHSERIISEVMVDFERAFEEVSEWRPGIDSHYCYSMDVNERGDTMGIDRDEIWDMRFYDEFIEAEQQKWKAWERHNSGPTEEDDLLLLPDRVFAFVLRTRKWGKQNKKHLHE
jgi:hypothetical protein